MCEEISFYKEVAPVCLPENSGQIYDSVTAIVSGWGIEKCCKGSGSNILKAVEVNTMANADCRILNELYTHVVNNDTICAAETGVDACTGDSGGNKDIRQASDS